MGSWPSACPILSPFIAIDWTNTQEEVREKRAQYDADYATQVRRIVCDFERNTDCTDDSDLAQTLVRDGLSWTMRASIKAELGILVSGNRLVNDLTSICRTADVVQFDKRHVSSSHDTKTHDEYCDQLEQAASQRRELAERIRDMREDSYEYTDDGEPIPAVLKFTTDEEEHEIDRMLDGIDKLLLAKPTRLSSKTTTSSRRANSSSRPRSRQTPTVVVSSDKDTVPLLQPPPPAAASVVAMSKRRNRRVTEPSRLKNPPAKETAVTIVC